MLSSFIYKSNSLSFPCLLEFTLVPKPSSIQLAHSGSPVLSCLWLPCHPIPIHSPSNHTPSPSPLSSLLVPPSSSQVHTPTPTPPAPSAPTSPPILPSLRPQTDACHRLHTPGSQNLALPSIFSPSSAKLSLFFVSPLPFILGPHCTQIAASKRSCTVLLFARSELPIPSPSSLCSQLPSTPPHVCSLLQLARHGQALYWVSAIILATPSSQIIISSECLANLSIKWPCMAHRRKHFAPKV